MAPKILVVLSSHTKINNLDKPTGWFLPEFAHPYYKLVPHCHIVVASPAGGEAPVDRFSVALYEGDEECRRFLKEQRSLWHNTEKLEKFIGKADEFDALFFVGGHGCVFDLAQSAAAHKIIREFYEASKVVSAVCHGQAAFMNVKLSDGTYMLEGQRTTGFSNAEEDQTGVGGALPFLIENRLKERSGNPNLYEKAKTPWKEHVTISGKSGKLITGQNPASSRLVGDEILKAITAR